MNDLDLLDVFGGGQAVTPLTIAPVNLKAWWNIDRSVVNTDVGTNVDSVSDLSGNGRTLIQNTDANQPQIVTNQLNGKSIISFDGVSEFMLNANADSYWNFLHNGTGSTVAFICKVANANPDTLSSVVSTMSATEPGITFGQDDRASQARNNRVTSVVVITNTGPGVVANSVTSNADGSFPSNSFQYAMMTYESGSGDDLYTYVDNVLISSIGETQSPSAGDSNDFKVGVIEGTAFYAELDLFEIVAWDKVLTESEREDYAEYVANETAL